MSRYRFRALLSICFPHIIVNNQVLLAERICYVGTGVNCLVARARRLVSSTSTVCGRHSSFARVADLAKGDGSRCRSYVSVGGAENRRALLPPLLLPLLGILLDASAVIEWLLNFSGLQCILVFISLASKVFRWTWHWSGATELIRLSQISLWSRSPIFCVCFLL